MFELAEDPGLEGLWGISAAESGLVDGRVYHYWFEVTDTSPFRERLTSGDCSDRLARYWPICAGRLDLTPPGISAPHGEVARILREASAKATKLLGEQRGKLEKLTEGLLAKEELDEREIETLLGPSIHHHNGKPHVQSPAGLQPAT